jgi:hypothetical protein
MTPRQVFRAVEGQGGLLEQALLFDIDVCQAR